MKSEKGITLLILIITIIMMSIIGFTVVFTAEGIKRNVDDDILVVELKKINNIVLQEWNKKIVLEDYDLLGDNDLTGEDMKKYAEKLGLENFKETPDKYYKLLPSDFESIGIKDVESTYIVCYETGEVANVSYYKTTTGEILYTK